MGRKIRKAAAVLLVLALLQALDVEKVKKRLEQIGGLKFRKDVPVVFLSPDRFRHQLLKYLKKDIDLEAVRLEREILTSFGLIPEDFPYLNFKQQLFIANAVGFYDDRFTHSLYIMDLGDESLLEFALVHELRHALQDQHFGINNFLSRNLPSFADRNMAGLALLEGDATFTTLLYFGKEDMDLAGRLTSRALLSPSPNFPSFLKAQLICPYVAGFSFIKRLYRKNGWRAVMQVFRNPPRCLSSLREKLCPCKERPDWKGPKGFSFRLGSFFMKQLLGEAAEGIVSDRLWILDNRFVLAIEAENPEKADKLAEALRHRFENVSKNYKIIIVKIQREASHDSSYRDQKRNNAEH